MGDREIKLINSNNSWIKFHKISLKNVESIQLNYGVREALKEGWKVEVRINSAKGKVIGEETFGIGAKERERSKAIVSLRKDFDEDSLYDVFFVFHNMDSEEQAGIGVMGLQLQAE